MKSFKRSLGFTLVEIVVVIGIMALLTTIVYTSLSGSKSQNRDQQRVADISNIQLSLEMFFSRHKYYPSSLNVLVPTFISAVPSAPNKGEVYNYVPLVGIGPTENGISSKCAKYHLWTTLETRSSVLDTKKGFNSVDSGGWCTSIAVPDNAINAASSTNSLVYDVIPQ